MSRTMSTEERRRYSEAHGINWRQLERAVDRALDAAEVRAKLAELEKCDDDCPGWAVFDVDREPGLEIERCDACFMGSAFEKTLRDDDVAKLPEARKALADEWRKRRRRPVWPKNT